MTLGIDSEQKQTCDEQLYSRLHTLKGINCVYSQKEKVSEKCQKLKLEKELTDEGTYVATKYPSCHHIFSLDGPFNLKVSLLMPNANSKIADLGSAVKVLCAVVL